MSRGAVQSADFEWY